jgi:hypothetical protein
MIDSERFKLLHGPYGAPRWPLGKRVFCEMRGWVKFTGMSAGRIQWPCAKVKGGWPFILCSDLVKAVRRESALAICYWWGVTPQTVTKWRKALDVGAYNEGTLRLHRDWIPEKVPPEVHARAIAAASTPEANAKKTAARLGHRVNPRVAAILAKGRQRCQSRAARKKRSDTRRRLNMWPPAAGPAWTAEEDALLAKLPDAAVAQQSSRSLSAVQNRRRLLKIRQCAGSSPRWVFGRPVWTEAQLRLLGKLPDYEVAKRIGRTEVAVTVRRSRLGIPTAMDRRRKSS